MTLRRRTKGLLVAVLVAWCTGSAFGVPPAGAAPAPNPSGQARLDLTVRFLQNQQNDDGGWGGRPGGASDPGFTAWVALALAAGGVNPMDQAKPGGTDAYTYLVAHADELKYTTDFERVLLVAVAAGGSARDFGGVDLVAQILERQLPDGSFRHEAKSSGGGINDTAFAILPLSTINDPALGPVIAAAADWLVTVQSDSGGWSYNPNVPFGVSSDMTASVIEALRAAGRADTDAEQAGWRYLRKTYVDPQGGFAEQPDESEANTASTAWTVQGMWAAGIEPATYDNPPPGPLDFMASMQDEQGMIRWKASTVGDQMNPVWMTAFCAPAFAGYPLPIPLVARADKTVQAPPATTPDQGVTAGGGGQGAPLFSKPEPQSQGQTAGGVRATTPTAQQAEPHESTKRRRPAKKNEGGERTTAASNGNQATGVTRDAAPDQSTPADPTTPTATPVATTPTAGLAGEASGAGGAAGAGGPPQVRGDVISAPRSGADGTGDQDAAAPGLRAAPEPTRALAAGLAALLLVAVFSGMNLERQRVAGTA